MCTWRDNFLGLRKEFCIQKPISLIQYEVPHAKVDVSDNLRIDPTIRTKHETHFPKSKVPFCKDWINRKGVLMIRSDICGSINEKKRIGIIRNVPILSRTDLSTNILAVALLNSSILHFLPSVSFKHSLCIWWASSRVGTTITARTPVPSCVSLLLIGAPSEERTGNRYESVFPVPVGEIAARSRFYDLLLAFIFWNRASRVLFYL